MAVGKGREFAVTKAHDLNNKKVKVSMASSKMKKGIFSENQDVQKLTDLMERFHTLSGLYETKRKNYHREKTYHNGSKTPVKNKKKFSEITKKESLSIPKPIPPLAHIKPNKNGSKKSSIVQNSNPFLKDLGKVNDTFEAKLHSGKGIGVSVFRLKDSLSEQNVLQSVPQDDIKYSFHQPPPLPRAESSLYHEALASSHKYIIANGGNDPRKIGVLRQQTFAAGRSSEKLTMDIAKDIRTNINKAIVHTTTSLNKSNWIRDTEKANTIADFNISRKRQSKQKTHLSEERGDEKVVYTKENSDLVRKIEVKLPKDSDTSPRSYKKYQQEPVPTYDPAKSLEGKPILEKQFSNVSAKRQKRPHRNMSVQSPPTATFVDMSPRQSIEDKFDSENKNNRNKFASSIRIVENSTHKTTQSEESPVIKMPRFVRPNEDIVLNNSQDKSAVSIRPDLMSANSYYTSTYPKRRGTPLSSVRSTTATDLSKSTPELKVSPPPPQARSASHMQVLSPLSSHFISPPPPTPTSRQPSPTKRATPESDIRQYSYGRIQKAYASSDSGKPKDARRHRRIMAGRHGRLKKPVEENNDPKLDSGVQGRSCGPNATEEIDGVMNIEDDCDKEKSLQSKKMSDQIITKKDKLVENIIESSDKNTNLKQEPVFNANESFVIKSKQSIHEPSNGEVDNVTILNKKPQRAAGKLAPLMSLRSEMQKSKFILARTTNSVDNAKSPVHLVSDPVTFSVRHPSYAASSMPLIDEEKPQSSCEDSVDKDFAKDESEKPSKEVSLYKVNGLRNDKTEPERTVVVFFHHSQIPQEDSNGITLNTYPKYGAVYKNTLKTSKTPILQTDEIEFVHQGVSTKAKPDKNTALLRRGSKVEISEIVNKKKNEKVTKIKKKGESANISSIPPQLQKVNIKTTGGGGFKANAAHYSMLFRQHQRMKQDRDTFLRLMQEDFLRKQTPEFNVSRSLPKPKVSNLAPVSEFRDATIETDPVKFATMLKKFNSMYKTTNQKPTSYTMFSSGYPIKQEDSFEHVVQKHEPSDVSEKQSSIKLNYVWPDPKRNSSFPVGHIISKPAIKSVKSNSSNNSDASSTKSLSITDLNFELKTNEKNFPRGILVPGLGHASVQNNKLEPIMKSNGFVLRNPQKSRYAIFTLPEVPTVDLSEFEQSHSVNLDNAECDELLDSILNAGPHSAAILPDPGTTSYRLTHDVSFDEGSRYRTTGDFSHNLVKGKEDSRNHANINGLSNQFSSTMLTRNNETSNSAGPMRHEGRITVNNREHNNNNMTNTSNNNSNNISFKETVPLSLIRMDERFAADLPPASSPSSPAMSSALAASTSTSSFIPPPSASRQNASNTTITTAGGNIMFRLHKEKQNWNYRLGELSISGGGYYSSAVNSNTRTDLDTISSLNMTSISSTTQRAVSTRERISVAPKSRLSSRYTSKSDTNPAPSFSDPCISAPASFQQRLTDLSLLESETIKYERNRKLRRKKNQQDKDS